MQTHLGMTSQWWTQQQHNYLPSRDNMEGTVLYSSDAIKIK